MRAAAATPPTGEASAAEADRLDVPTRLRRATLAHVGWRVFVIEHRDWTQRFSKGRPVAPELMEKLKPILPRPWKPTPAPPIQALRR